MGCMYVDGVLLLQTILYFTIVATGLATAISSSLAKNDFGGQCVLYGKATCSSSGSGFNCDQVVYGRDSVCSFITAGNVFACVMYAFANGCYHAYSVHQSRVVIRVASKMYLRSLLFGSVLAFMITLVAACTVTVGLSTWCDNLQLYNGSHSTAATPVTDTIPASTTASDTTTAALWTTASQAAVNRTRRSVSSPPDSDLGSLGDLLSLTCSETQAKIWSINGERYGPNEYYYSFSVAESSCWVNVAIWLLQIIFYTRRMVKSCNQRQQNTYQDPFTTDDDFDVFN